MEGILADKQIQHLYWRAGYGLTSKELKKLRSLSKNEIIDQLFRNSEKTNELTADLGIFKQKAKNLTKQQKQNLQKKRREKMREINLLWFKQMQETDGVLREKITMFFQNHFSVRLQSPYVMLKFHNTIREHALGNFGSLLMAISKSPAMLQFLNNRQNRKKSPNENFAREVMELFTLGRDNGYTQQDIKEAARAFTGWSFNETANFVFKEHQHDDGEKTILGKTANFSGEEVIKLLLEQKQTAVYITEKLYRYLVNDTIDKAVLDQLAAEFYESGYDIKTVLNAIFRSKWFYEEKNIGTKIKSPTDLIVGINRQFKIKYEKTKTLFFMQQKLNQALFYPPNVAGWPGGKHWIDSSTLMLRLKLPTVLLLNGEGSIFEDDLDGNMSNMSMQGFGKGKQSFLSKKIGTSMNWKKYLDSLPTQNKKALISFYIQAELSKAALKSLSLAKEAPLENYIVAILSLPEYQLC